MIIGILEADDLAEEVLQQYGSYADMFATLLAAADSKLTFKTYPVTHQQYPTSIDDCDVYLITGSKSSCYEDKQWIAQLKQFVNDCFEQKKKLVGICFGHQLIAQALGGLVQKNEDGWGIGLVSSHVTQAPDWLSPQQKEFNLLTSHQDQVTQLPVHASLIATNDFCPIAGYQINSIILAFQGHPEFNRDYLRYIMAKRRDIIGDAVYQQAIISLEQKLDHELVATWIVNFINN